MNMEKREMIGRDRATTRMQLQSSDIVVFPNRIIMPLKNVKILR